MLLVVKKLVICNLFPLNTLLTAKKLVICVLIHTSVRTYVPVSPQIRKTLKSPDAYDNFLRCLLLFNEEIVTRNELIGLANGYLGYVHTYVHVF